MVPRVGSAVTPLERRNKNTVLQSEVGKQRSLRGERRGAEEQRKNEEIETGTAYGDRVGRNDVGHG